jgi:hypothetical protein
MTDEFLQALYVVLFNQFERGLDFGLGMKQTGAQIIPHLRTPGLCVPLSPNVASVV